MIDTSTPNIYTVWITLITTLGGILGGAVTLYLTRKLGAIHTLVNGNLHAALQTVDKLRTKLTANGLDPDA